MIALLYCLTTADALSPRHIGVSLLGGGARNCMPGEVKGVHPPTISRFAPDKVQVAGISYGSSVHRRPCGASGSTSGHPLIPQGTQDSAFVG